MTLDPGLEQWLMGILVFTAICTTAFPALYAFSPWYRSTLGRMIMLRGIALAMLIDLTLLFKFWIPESDILLFAMSLGAFGLVAVSSLSLTFELWVLNHKGGDFMGVRKHSVMSVADLSEDSEKPLMSNKTYDVLKFVTQILLPGIGTLYFALSGIWGFPNAEQVVGTITAVVTFLGLLLNVSSKTYQESASRFDGVVNVEQPSDERTLYSLEVSGDPAEIANKNEITLKVNKPV